MEETEVVQAIRSFFESKNWEVICSAHRYESPFEIDIVAEKEGNKYLIQAKGDRVRQEYYQIQYALGQTVAVMHEENTQIHYALALTETVSRDLWKFQVAGLRALNLHVFIVTDYSAVYHLAPEALLEYIKRLRECGDAYPSTLSTNP